MLGLLKIRPVVVKKLRVGGLRVMGLWKIGSPDTDS